MIQASVVGRVSRPAMIGQASQNGDTPINVSLAVERLNPTNGQIMTNYVNVTYWKRGNQPAPFDVNAIQAGAMVFAQGTPMVETYNKQDGTTGYGMKITASTLVVVGGAVAAPAPAYQPATAPAPYPSGTPAPAPYPNAYPPQQAYPPQPQHFQAPQPARTAPQPAAPQPQAGGFDDVPF